MNKNYWNKYYSTKETTDIPSNFAKSCMDIYDNSFGHIYDIGCGNGRDTFYFAKKLIKCTGIDQSEKIIKSNNKIARSIGLKINFIKNDFSLFDYDSFTKGPFSIYSRFTLHAINYKEEERLFEHLYNSKRLKYLLIEARSINDQLYGEGKEIGLHEFVTTHYRRFIDPKQLKIRLLKYFNLISFEESQGFAKTNNEDPCLIRVVAKNL
jgi:SAM-dependent methyltransferase|tara:strand:- start:56 stop:682 length:627 start_codon:yes stop_codon:yes gene_type:complete